MWTDFISANVELFVVELSSFNILICLMQPKSRVSPPTSPSSSDEVAIARKLAEAQERKQSLEQEKAKRLADHLEKISLAKEKKEKEHEKFSAKVLEVSR